MTVIQLLEKIQLILDLISVQFERIRQFIIDTPFINKDSFIRHYTKINFYENGGSSMGSKTTAPQVNEVKMKTLSEEYGWI
jgi:hypothetical protein